MPVNNKSIANLIPPKKGEIRNPYGAPRKLPELDKLLAEVLGEDKDGISTAMSILKALIAKAIKGDIRAAEVLLDRAYGKAKQSIDLEANMFLTTVTPQIFTSPIPLASSEKDVYDGD